MKSARLALVVLVLLGSILACGGRSDRAAFADYLNAQVDLMEEADALGLPGDGPDSWTVATQLAAQNLAQRSLDLPATPACMATFRQACDDAWFYQVMAIEAWVTFGDPGQFLVATDLLLDAFDRQEVELAAADAACR